MSNYLSIATVTATLRRYLLEECSPIDKDHLSVTTIRPASPTGGAAAGLPNPGVNIFLYQTQPSPALLNAELPVRRADGSLVERPRAALVLNYLLSMYGDDAALIPQRLLGIVIRALHTRPVLTREMIRATVADQFYSSILAGSTLGDAPELVRFTPVHMSVDEMSKLWSTFAQTPYALSAVYQASMVFVEADVTPRDVLPVRDRRILVMPFQSPVIDAVEPQMVFAESSLTIRGQNLGGAGVKVKFGDIVTTPLQANTAGDRIGIDLPDNTTDLRYGIRTVQVAYDLRFRPDEETHPGFESNLGVFMLCPQFTPPEVGDLAPSANDSPLLSGIVKVVFHRKIEKRQRVSLSLYPLNPPPEAAITSYRLPAPPENGIPAKERTTDNIAFPFTRVVPGNYLVRAQVDDADSGFTSVDELGNRFEPSVTIKLP
jgi:hypothetical protein